MAKKTLLELVQNILSSMDSDEVNSISDTVEALQVAEIVRETYEDIIENLSIPEKRSLIRLESVSDVDRPNYLRIPNGVKTVTWIRYNTNLVDYVTPEDFIAWVFKNPGNVTVTDTSDITYTIDNAHDPRFWTSFTDDYLVFSSFNQAVESTLQEVNSMAYAELSSTFSLDDNFIPAIDDNLFPLLLQEAKAIAFIDLKQVSNSGEERRARRSLVRAQNGLNRASTGNPKDRLPNYSRRR